ncbi:protein quaking [Pimephales promelas]|nr:protein quaking [Pimephales promelas]
MKACSEFIISEGGTTYDVISQWRKGAVTTKVRRQDMRVHPYQRVVTAERAATGN